MINVFLDPIIFSCPKPEAPIDEIESFIKNIVAWRELKESKWANVYITSRTIDILMQEECYPLWNDLHKAIEMIGDNSIELKDVVKVVDELLNKLPYIEDILKINEILVDKFTCNPSEHLLVRTNLFTESYQRLMVLIKLNVIFNNANDFDHIVITRHLTHDNLNVEIYGEIIDIDYNNRQEYFNEMPAKVKGKFPSCNCPHGLYLSAKPSSIWLNEDCTTSKNIALKTYIYQRLNGADNLDSITNLNWSFGRNFFGTANDLGFISDNARLSMLLKACADTILKENLSETHFLRIDSGGNSPQRRRGNDKAWRRDIDREYHLHYWETSNGTEFASIVIHNDMRIPE